MDKAYENKVVLITGATGFIGTALLKTMAEHLKGIKRIYCLYRATAPGTVSIADDRLVWVKGDVAENDWGLSAEVLAVLKQEVEVVFNLAAYTRWDTPIQDQVKANTLSALHGADLVATFERLERYVVTSSYWAMCSRSAPEIIEERIYQDFEAEAELEEILVRGNSARLSEWPNAYSYSKNLMERLLHQRYPNLPIMVARVTSVAGAWNYPERGHCNFNISLPAFIRSIVLGGVKFLPVSTKAAINDMVPIDICVNLLLANAIHPANSTFQVINCSSAKRNSPTLGAVAEMAGDITYFGDAREFEGGLASLNEKQAKLNKLIVGSYGFAMSTRFVFDDAQARRPLQWMSAECLSRFPIDVDTIDWPSIIHAMKRKLTAV
ncbi:SDR family oxidoreductase [Pseudomonas sp. Marseille-QA0892]